MDKLPTMNISAENSSVDRRSFLERSGYQHLEHGDLRVLIPVVLGVICVLGFSGNVTAMGVLITNARKSKLSLINALILNLMLADGLVLAFAVPFKATAYSRASWTLGLFICKTCDWFLHSCMAAKSFTLAIMAKACYRYVSNPTKQVSIRLKTILVVLLFTWLLACAVPIPQWLFSTLQREANGMICVQTVPVDAQDFMSVYVKAYPLLAYCMPLSFALLYFWKAYGRCQRRFSKTQNLRTQIRSRKLTLMLFSLMVAMATMWLPQWVSWVWMRHALETDGAFPPVLFTLSAQLLMFSISLINPLIILALSEEFREGYIGLWRRLTLRKQLPKQHKPGPHTPTAPKSPTPRPETSAHLPPHQPGRTEEQKPEKQVDQSEGQQESPTNKDGIVLQDVEQFWQERETGSHSHENDPVPWEHQDPKEGKLSTKTIKMQKSCG
uniref:GPCR-2037 n=1 Tax=Cyprinus carpio carpio TaxID=630221 RepID=A0A9J8D1H4_CYPCA